MGLNKDESGFGRYARRWQPGTDDSAKRNESQAMSIKRTSHMRLRRIRGVPLEFWPCHPMITHQRTLDQLCGNEVEEMHTIVFTDGSRMYFDGYGNPVGMGPGMGMERRDGQ